MNIINSINHFKGIIAKQNVSGFTRFTFSITGANYTGTINNYPITFNSSTTSDTWADILNFTKTDSQNANITLYFKGKWLKYIGENPRIFCFTDNTPAGNPFALINVTNADNTGKNINYTVKMSGIAGIDTTTGPLSMTNGNDYFHTFLRFNSSTSKYSYYFYKNDGTLLFNTGEETYNPATNMTNFTKFRLAFVPFTNVGSWVTIGEAGYYNSVLNTTYMTDVVNQNPN